MSENQDRVFSKTSINWYPGHMAKTKRLIKENIDHIDIVYEIIDARIPYSSKIKDINEYIGNKPKILIMTKIDLCDLKETEKWMKYYETKGYHVIKMNLEKNTNIKPLLSITEEVTKTLQEKRISKGLLKRKIRALVVGVPNVGKSTLINRLANKKAVNVGNKPGITKNLDWIRVNDKVELLDTPGILWPKLEDQIGAFNLASFTAIKEEVLPLYDIVEYILRTLQKYYPNKLLERYGIEEVEEDMITTLEIIGKKRGCLLRGGQIDYDKAVSIVMNDIKEGYIKEITFDRYQERIEKTKNIQQN